MIRIFNYYLICVFIFLLILPAFSQYKNLPPDQMPSFSVGPMVIDITGRPGQTINRKVTLLTRNYNKPQNFLITQYDLIQNNAVTCEPTEIGLGTKSCADWIDISEKVVAQPNDRIEIPFSVKIPYDRNLKGHYFAYIDISTDPKRPSGQFAVVVKYKLPVKIKLTIPGEALLRLNVKELKYNKKKYNSNANLSFVVKNEGEWLTTITGDVLLNKIGSVAQSIIPIPYAPTTGKAIEVYPQSEVKINCEMEKELAPGEYAATVRMLMNQFGRTQANFNFNVNRKNTTIAKLKSKAEFDLDLQVSPYLIEIPLRPGAVRYLNIRVKNNNKLPIDMNAKLFQAKMETNGNYTFIENSTSKITKVLEYSPAKYTIKPFQATAIKAKLEIPQNFNFPSQAVYAFKISALPANQEENSEWISKGESTVPILIYDAAAKEPKLECTKFDIIKPSTDLNPTTAIVRVKNNEGKIAKVRGRITLRSNSGREYAFMDIGRIQPELILGGSEREFRFEIPTLDEGEFIISAELRLDGKKNKRDLALFEEKAFTAVAVMPEGL